MISRSVTCPFCFHFTIITINNDPFPTASPSDSSCVKVEPAMVKCQHYTSTLVCEVAAHTPTKGFVDSVLIGSLLVTIPQLNVSALSALRLHPGSISHLCTVLFTHKKSISSKEQESETASETMERVLWIGVCVELQWEVVCVCVCMHGSVSTSNYKLIQVFMMVTISSSLVDN